MQTHGKEYSMKFSIGFNSSAEEKTSSSPAAGIGHSTPVKSAVRVFFPDRNMTLSYYNDAFDLKPGDIVYVEGKLEGLCGRVVEVSLSFKIKLSDYKRVIGLADTDVTGRLFFAGSHMVSFEPHALPYEKVRTWFMPPENDEEYVTGNGGASFQLSDLSGMKISSEIAERGHDYYIQNKVSYISLDGYKGKAIVEGTRAYELEFEYRNGEISGLNCNCFCAYPCKHEFAAMLQLKETLEKIEKDYRDEFARTGYFAAVSKPVLFTFAVDSKDSGSITLD